MSRVAASHLVDRAQILPVTIEETRLDGVLEGWKRELRRKILFLDDEPQDFLRRFVPSNAPALPHTNIGDVFRNWRSEKGKEVESYEGLIQCLTDIVSTFPDDKRVSFVDCHKTVQKFPFHAFAPNHHSTYPDIVVSFPGKTVPDSPTWLDFSMIIEVKSSADEDPFGDSTGLKYSKTLVQLAVNARNLMHAHGALAVFVLGLYGSKLRIVRFDHSAAVVCQALDVHDNRSVATIRQFFWQFVHPCTGTTVVGCDPTVRRLATADEEWLTRRLELVGKKLDAATLAEARHAEIHDDQNGETRSYFMFQVLDVNGRLFSRATTVWLAIPDTRVFVDGRFVSDPEPAAADLKVRIVKEAWRQLVRRSERDFYERLRAIPDKQRVGLAKILCGGDMGELEVQEWERALYGAATAREVDIKLEQKRHQRRLVRPRSTSFSGASSTSPDPSSLSSTTSTPEAPEHRPLHQTFSWRQALGKKHWSRERSHTRLVIDIVGRPLTHFRTTKEMVTALRDAIKGHRLAMSRGGVLHRDVSIGNVLIVDDGEDQGKFAGFLHDFDYSSMSKTPPVKNLSRCKAARLTEILFSGDDFLPELKERTGTFHFLALELLARNGISHEIHHDLESFYWVLLWVVLRHTDHTHSDGQAACAVVFQNSYRWAATGGKNSWLTFQSTELGVHGNPPLTYLLRELGRLVRIGLNPDNDKTLEYDDVLRVFNKALDFDDWPEDDVSIPYNLPDLRTNNITSNPKAPQKCVHVNRSTKRKAGDGDLDDDAGERDRNRMLDRDGDTTMEDYLSSSSSSSSSSPPPRHVETVKAKGAQPPKRRRVISEALQVQPEDAEMQSGPSRPRTRSRTASRPERAPAPALAPARARPQRRAASRPERGQRAGRAAAEQREDEAPTVESLKEWGGPATGTRGRRLKKDTAGAAEAVTREPSKMSKVPGALRRSKSGPAAIQKGRRRG